MCSTIYADLRLLQDPEYQKAEPGYHFATLLNERVRSALCKFKIIGLVDPWMPPLPTEFSALVDRLSFSTNPCQKQTEIDIFIDGAPMMYDKRFGLRFHTNSNVLRAAILYDFVPMQEGDIPAAPSQRIEYLAKIAGLRNFDLIFPISAAVGSRVSEFAAVPKKKIFPTGRILLLKSQSNLARGSMETTAGALFWETLASAYKGYRQSISSTREMPWLAFLGPYLPERSDAAVYTANTLRACNKLFDSDLYTDESRPLRLENGIRDAGKVSFAPMLRTYNAIVSVLGGLSSQMRISEVLERCGGPCILHDPRVTRNYFQELGSKRFLDFTSKLLSRSVSMEEASMWLSDYNLPAPFLGSLLRRASPLIVNTNAQQALVRKHYGIDAQIITCCPTLLFMDDEISESAQKNTRTRLGLQDGSFIILSFGTVATDKSVEISILAVEFLKSWGIPAELFFGGEGYAEGEIDRISSLYGIANSVHCLSAMDDVTYRNFLIASDAGLQLLSRGFGQLSSTLMDCISAGLPCVSSSGIAEACGAPEFIARVPDRFSSLQIAEQLAMIYERRGAPRDKREQRAEFLRTHNFEQYGRRLIEILGL